jgi:hypothetical protein
VETVEFGSTADAAQLLAAFQGLSGLMNANPSRRVPSGCLDENKIEADVVTSGWRPLVFRKDRPPETVDRDAYGLCGLEQFHKRLKRRDIFTSAASR